MAGELNKSVEANKLISAPKPIKSSGSIKSSTVDALKVTEPQQAKIPETLPGTYNAITTTRSENEKAYEDTTNVIWVFATNARVAEFSNVS
jgi:hypothetical protein